MLFQNLLIAEYVKQMHHHNDLRDIWFWRDTNGNEIDLLTEGDDGFSAIEFKAPMTVMPNMFKGLTHFEAISGWKNLRKDLVYSGDATQNRTAGKVVPWKDFGI